MPRVTLLALIGPQPADHSLYEKPLIEEHAGLCFQAARNGTRSSSLSGFVTIALPQSALGLQEGEVGRRLVEGARCFGVPPGIAEIAC